jgi:hypothetical protein
MRPTVNASGRKPKAALFIVFCERQFEWLVWEASEG